MALPSIVQVPWHSGPKLGRLIDITPEGNIIVVLLGGTFGWTFEPWDVTNPTDDTIEQYNANSTLPHWNGKEWDDGLFARYWARP